MTTLQQIASLPDNKKRSAPYHLKMMTGAYNFVYSKKDSWISFRWKAGVTFSAKSPNYVKITLNKSDTYDMQFLHVPRRPTYEPTTVVIEHKGVYADMLTDLFEETTGLYLRMNLSPSSDSPSSQPRMGY